jgi:cation transport protein ChaC
VQNDIWVFGFGSLMWDPGFAYTDRRPALVHGYHRALCVYSVSYRGTHDCPGLVLGLDRGGSCRGIAFRVEARNQDTVIDYLHGREMNNNAYAPRYLNARLDGGAAVRAYSFIARRDHPQYTGKISLARTVELVLQGIGPRGTALAYLQQTVVHMDELGIGDGPLHRVLQVALDRSQQNEKRQP